jgi:chaperone required for assembly of F1-ATPase
VEHWEPLLDWVKKTYDVEVTKSESLLSPSQPEETKIKLGKVLDGFDHWEMAGNYSLPHRAYPKLIEILQRWRESLT